MQSRSYSLRWKVGRKRSTPHAGVRLPRQASRTTRQKTTRAAETYHQSRVRDVRQHRIAAGRAGLRSYGGRSSVGRARYETCFEKRHKQQFSAVLAVSCEKKTRTAIFLCAWDTVVAGSSPAARLSGRTVKLPGAPLSPERDRIFLHAPGSRPGCMADIAQR